MEPDFIDEERVPLIEAPQDDDVQYQETSFDDQIIQKEANAATLRYRERELDKIDTQINALERNFGVDIPAEKRGSFRLINGYLQVRKSAGEFVSVTKANGEFLAASTLRTRLGASLARSLLGVETPVMLKTQSRILLDKVDIEMDDLTPQRLDDIIGEVSRDMATNTDLDMREFLGIDKALTRIKGELENNASKLTEIDEHLAREYEKLKELEDDPEYSDELRNRTKERISDLKEERSARLEILNQNRKELASQFSRIRQTVEKILDGDLTLREKLRLIFREHGLTITAVLTSLGLIISTLITSLTGGSAASTTPPKHPVKGWLKNKLKALARLFGRLAGKAAAALPGIIGSIVAGVLNFLKKVVTAAANNIWLFLTSMATLIGYRLMYPPDRKKR